MAFLEKEMEIVAIRPSIMRDIDTLLQFVQDDSEDKGDWLIFDKVRDAAARVEKYLRDVPEAEAKETV